MSARHSARDTGHSAATRPVQWLQSRYLLPVLCSLIGCSTEPETAPNPPLPPGPAAPRWSDPASWPGGAVPQAGAAVTIAAGRTILLDVSPLPLRSLTVDGVLELDQKNLDLKADWIVVHGTLRIGTEAEPFTKRAVITLTGPASDQIEGAGAKVLAVIGGTLDLHGEPRLTWTRLTATAAAGSSQLQLSGAVDWRPGERIVVASTDFDPFQAEEAVVASVQGQTVTLQAPLRYLHWGQLQSFGGRQLDERAEVGLLGRNVVIQGDSASLAAGFGGHLIVMQRGQARIEGVEFTRMGQKKLLARYPMHWHLSGDVTGQYFRNNSVWKTFNRCLTIHGTSNLSVSGNVCHDNIGHAYFLEDGAETGNVLDGNLGLVTRRPATGEAVLPSDVDPATFWITNPANVFRRNAAAGSRGFGYWYALPVSPTGLSVGSPLKPRATPLGEFSDNVAHSNGHTGLNVDHGPRPDGVVETAHYAPRQIPGDNASPLVTAYFRNITAYKNSARAVWLRGTELRLEGAMLSDNRIGATFASNETFLKDAVIVGTSANSATPFARGFPVRGYEFYDGRVGAERVTFFNFQPTADNYMSALGYLRQNGFPISTGNFVKGLTFVNTNSVFLEDPRADRDGDKAAVILDDDGSLTGTAGTFVAANHPLLVTPACTRRNEWNAYLCASRFVNLRVRTGNNQPIAPLDLVRDDGVSGTFVGVPNVPWSVSASVVPGRLYRVKFTGAPSEPQVFANMLAPTDWVRVELPYPTGLVKVYRDYNTATSIAAAASLAELDASTGDKFFYDTTSGMLHLKAMARQGRNWAALFVKQ